MITFIIGLYFLVILAIGFLGHRYFRHTGEDYFLASRTIGLFVLLFTLFSTHMTAFTILGASSQAHVEGIIVYALIGSATALSAPLVFYFVGVRVWRLSVSRGFMTQPGFFRDRYQSGTVGLTIFIIQLILLLPYVLIGIKGGGQVFNAISGGGEGGYPVWVGSFLICAVGFTYVAYGGIRSTSWVNTFQGILFLFASIVICWVILKQYGGLHQAITLVEKISPEHLVVEDTPYLRLRLFSYLIISSCVCMFPHVFAHWLTAKNSQIFRRIIVIYPVCIFLIWFPMVLIGVVAVINYPGVPEMPVIMRMILDHSGYVLAGLLVAGVFAAIMSSLDSQALAVGTMFTQDIVRHYGFHDRLSEKLQIRLGRLFILAFLVLAFVVSLYANDSIFALGVWSLTGFSSLIPVMIAALYWKRSTATGVVAALITMLVAWIGFYLHSVSTAGEYTGDYTVMGTGIMPIIPIFLLTSFVLVVVSLLTKPPAKAHLTEFFSR